VAEDERSARLVLACFALSGFAALLYQTAWTHEFAFVFGTSELAVATVLAAYMGGLSLGSAVAGRLAPRIRRPVLAYGLLELGVALAALGVPRAVAASTALTVALFGGAPEPPAAAGALLPAFQLLLAFAILLVPTALMGATLPLLARHAVRGEEELGPRIAVLYAANTAGAVLGTLAAAFALLPALGLRGAVQVGVAANALVFALAAAIARRAPAAPPAAAAPAPATEPGAGRRRWVLPLILVSGAVSFGYEVLWTRLLAFVLGGSVYAFATMLASFLVGIAAGSALATRAARTPAAAARGFAVAQLCVAAASLAAFRAVDALPGLVGPAAGALPGRAALAGGLLLLPSTLAIGATFPLAVRVLARGPADAGPASARVYAWNTLGAIAGALGAGFALIPALGFERSAALFAAVSLALALTSALALAPRSNGLALVSAAGLALLPWVHPAAPERLLRSSPLARAPVAGEIVYSAVGRSATVLLVESQGAWKLRSNGLPEAAILPPGRFRADDVNAWLAALPTLLRPAARSLLVVGLGGGALLEAAPASLASIDVIELEPQIVEANRRVAAVRARDPLADPRVHIVENDARGALLLTRRRWDAIVSQPSHPWTAGASHLYTREFFELVKGHLAPGGVFVQWIGLGFVDEGLLRALVSTLTSVFPQVRVYQPGDLPALLFAASQEAFPPESVLEDARRADAAACDALALFDPEDLAAALRLDAEGARRFAAGAPVIRDDRNLLEMRAPRVRGRALKSRELDALFAPFDPLASPRGLRAALLVRRLAARSETARARRVAAAAEDPASRRLAAALLEAARGGAAAETALRAVLAAEPGATDARAALALWEQRTRGAEAAAQVAGGLPAPEAAVAAGWLAASRGDWRAVARLDPDLEVVAPHSVLHPEALRLRVRWRLETADGGERSRAVFLANALAALRLGHADRLLRVRAASAAGLAAAALGDLEELAGADRSPAGRRGVLAALRELPADPALAARRDALEARLSPR
jgi:spermidine synthase